MCDMKETGFHARKDLNKYFHDLPCKTTFV